MTFEELKAKLEQHCPGAVVTGSKGSLAALRRQQLAKYAKDQGALPPSRPVTLQVLDPDGRLIGTVTAQFAEDGGLAFAFKLFEDKKNEPNMLLPPEMLKQENYNVATTRQGLDLARRKREEYRKR